MNEEKNEFLTILNNEEKVLDAISQQHVLLKKAVNEKNWEDLNKVISAMNNLSTEFQTLDAERDVIQNEMKAEELQPYFEKISVLRSKLLKCKIENEAFSKYVNITKDFIQGVIENAIPQRRSKVYSKTGQIVQSQPQSVILSRLF